MFSFQDCFHSFNFSLKELYIRIFQATIFVPYTTYCIGAWQFDQETVDIIKYLDKIHSEYSDLIIERHKLAITRGDPMYPPLWWLDPEDKVAQSISDGQIYFLCSSTKYLNITFIYRISTWRNSFGGTSYRKRKGTT